MVVARFLHAGDVAWPEEPILPEILFVEGPLSQLLLSIAMKLLVDRVFNSLLCCLFESNQFCVWAYESGLFFLVPGVGGLGETCVQVTVAVFAESESDVAVESLTAIYTNLYP